VNIKSCLNIKEWKDSVFEGRYTSENLMKCENYQQILDEIQKVYKPLSIFTTEITNLYNKLSDTFAEYKSEFRQIYNDIIKVSQSLWELVQITKELLESIGDEKTGFISSINCRIFLSNLLIVY